MKNSKRILVGATIAGLFAVAGIGGAQAQGGRFPAAQFSANVGFLSDYIFRGVSQTGEDPALQGGLDMGLDNGLYFGAWGSSIDFDDDAQLEIDYYGGLTRTLAGIEFDGGITYYSYPAASADYNFVEFSLGLGFDVLGATISAGGRYSPDNFGASGNAVYLSSGVELPLTLPGKTQFKLAASLGHQSIEDEQAFGLADYYDWSAAVIASRAGFDFALTYHDTDVGAGCPSCAARVVFSVSRGF